MTTCQDSSRMASRTGPATDQPSPRRGERRRARRIEEILQTSTEVLADRGYHDMNLDEVAERLDVTTASLYHYFAGKDELVMACLERVADETNSRLAEIAAEPGTPTERLRRLIEHQLRVSAREHPAGVRLFALPMAWPESFASPLRRMRAAHDEAFQQVVREGLASGEFEVDDEAVARQCLHGALNQVSYWTRRGRRPSSSTIAAVRDTVLKMFLPGPARP